MYHVYVLENQEDKSLYTGFTENLENRILAHNSGKGGRTTKLKKGWKLVYYEAYLLKEDAIGREKFLKGGSGRKYLKKATGSLSRKSLTKAPLGAFVVMDSQNTGRGS